MIARRKIAISCLVSSLFLNWAPMCLFGMVTESRVWLYIIYNTLALAVLAWPERRRS